MLAKSESWMENVWLIVVVTIFGMMTIPMTVDLSYQNTTKEGRMPGKSCLVLGSKSCCVT